MIPIQDFELHAKKFLQPDQSVAQRLQLATEIRDSIEIAHTNEYNKFLKYYFRVFVEVLTRLTKPQAADVADHKLRNVVLEILNRLPHNETLKPHVSELLKLSLIVLKEDNEENAVICLRIIFDLHKNFRPHLESEVQPFLDYVCLIYHNFKATVSYFFDNAGEPQVQLAGQGPSNQGISYLGQRTPGAGGPVPGQLNRSTCSFKVINDCPLLVMFLFQLYQRFVAPNIPKLLPLMVQAIAIPGPQHVPPHLKQAYADLKAAQIKTLSFLTYLLRSHNDFIRPHEESIARSIVNLLVSCPDLVNTRKELLIATRHVLATDFKRGFFAHMDTLLDDRVLVGTGRACYETLRPLAYSLLAELIHNVRLELSLEHLSRIVYMFSRNVHDSTLPLNVQITCVRLMLNLVETIFGRRVDPSTREDGRALLGRILDAFISKFGSLKRSIPLLLEKDENGEEGNRAAALRQRLELPVQAALSLQLPPEHAKEMSDCKQLIKTLIMGMKTLLWSITHFNQANTGPQQPATPIGANTKGMREDEVRLAAGVLRSGVRCLAVFREKEEEDMYIHFASVFTVMEPRNFTDMFSLTMPSLFQALLDNNHLMQIFAALLHNSKMSRHFAEVLAHYLVTTKLDTLGNPEKGPAQMSLQLFRILFGAVAKYPADCERVLQPHVLPLMEACMKGAQELDRPTGYMQLLRTMFRALSGHKFDLLYKEFVPTLLPCLTLLLALLDSPSGTDMRDLLIELCLTLPARLSSLLSHLPRLMKPLVLALKGSEELVAAGLRTLEFWLDSLNLEFLEPNMQPVMADLIFTLWGHLRPKPYPWGSKALQLLGKLGGRNRRFLKEPLELECKDNPEHGLRLILTFEPSTSFLVPLDRCIHLARAAITNPAPAMTTYYRKHALQLLRVCLVSVLNLKANADIHASGISPGHISAMLLSYVDPTRRRPETAAFKVDLGVKTKTQLMAERGVFKTLLMAVIASNAESDLLEPKDEFVSNICRHFAMLFHIDAMEPPPGVMAVASLKPPSGGSGGGDSSETGPAAAAAKGKARQQANLKELEPSIFLDALVAVLADENRSHARAALQGLNTFAETLILLARAQHSGVSAPRSGMGTPGTPMAVSSPSLNPVLSPPPSLKVPVFEQLLPRLLHCCYGATWQAQMGGVMGLGALVGRVSVDTLSEFQVRAVRGLLHVLKRLPPHANKEQEDASSALNQVLRVVNNMDESNNTKRKEAFDDVVEVLACELFNPSAPAAVRKNVQQCLALLAARTGSEVSELLEKPHAPLLQPQLQRPLRMRTVDQQIAIVMSLNYCLSLRPPLLRLSNELVSILHEALSIAEADEAVLQVKYAKQAATLTKLRTVCIELLCTAMAWADLKQQTYAELRGRVIAMFFKSLTCKTPEIVAVAKEGLRQVINQQKMPKELLQSSLRPILVNLAHYKNLNLPLLQGLARLLELLSNWFNVTLGEKLVEHLKKWLEPDKLAQAHKAWKAGEEPKVAAAILEVFHLLPPAAVKFMAPLVNLTIQLELALPPSGIYSELHSPYRLPLTKFLNRYASEFVDFFLGNISNALFFRRFLDIIRSDAGQPLREELARATDKILQHAFPTVQLTSGGDMTTAGDPYAGGQGASSVHFQGVALVSMLVKLMPDWFPNNKPLFEALRRLWASPSRKQGLEREQDLSLLHLKESKRMVKCFLNYLRFNKGEVGILFDMLSIFLATTRIDYTFLKEFFMVEVPEKYSGSEKRAVLKQFLALFQARALPQDHRCVALQLLILPMLQYAFLHDQTWEVVDAAIVKTIVEQLLDPPEEVSAEYEEPLRIELLQLATVLIRHLPNELRHHRKELIKFGWNHLKREDSASKQWAFVNVCHFLEAYQAPEKIILQVFVALLRTCQPETRVLVKQALDVLMPALPNRLPLGDAKIPIWIRYTKKILVEEGHSLPHLIHIFQLLVRHSDLFYSSRAQFAPQMVNSLAKLGLPANSAPENRRLAIDLAGLVVSWEQRRQSEAKILAEGGTLDRHHSEAKPLPVSEGNDFGSSAGDGLIVGGKRSAEAAGFVGLGGDDVAKRVKVETGLHGVPGGGPSLQAHADSKGGVQDEEYKPNSNMEEMIINFLIRVGFVTEPKDRESTAMYKQALQLLGQALEVWPQANVKIAYMERLLLTQTSSGPSQATPAGALAGGGAGGTVAAGSEARREVPHALTTALDVLDTCLQKQPQMFVRQNAINIIQVMDASFTSSAPTVVASFCNVLRLAHLAFPSPAEARLEGSSTPPETTELQLKVDELLQKHLVAANTTPPHGGPAGAAERVGGPDGPSPNALISCCLKVVQTLCEVHCEDVVDKHMLVLVRTMQRLTKEHIASCQQLLRADQEVAEKAKVAVSGGTGPAVLSAGGEMAKRIVENLKLVLKLLRRRVLTVLECRKSFGTSLHQLLMEKGIHGELLLTILDIICDWVEHDFRGAASGVTAMGALNTKDVITFLLRLAHVDRQGMTDAMVTEWDSKFLHLLHSLCSDATKYSKAVREEVFEKVERHLLLGLRAPDPALRQAFFALYNAGDHMRRTLFHRLHFIVSGQDWDAMGDSFWLKHGLDLLLAILVEKEPITLAPNSAQVPPLMATGGVAEIPLANSLEEDAEGTPPTFQGTVAKHARFLSEVNRMQVSDLVGALGEMAVADSQVAYHLWVLVFPIVWATLAKEEQVQLAKPMISLLSKEGNIRQVHRRPNVIQALLEGISLSQPQPKIPSELIKYLGKRFNAWHIAIPLLESHVMLFPQETRCFDALAELYRLLGEDDILCGLWHRRNNTADTRAGLSLVQHGFWQQAQDVFFSAVNRSLQGVFGSDVAKAETCLWEEQWLACARRLNQWEIVADFARDVDNPELLCESLWRVGDWEGLRARVLGQPHIEDTSHLRMVQAYAALNQGTGIAIQQADEYVGQGLEMALHKWWQLPELGVAHHVPLLQQFQQLVELQESSRVLLDIVNGSKHPPPGGPGQSPSGAGPGGLYVDLKDILETWRLRVPNEWEDLVVWDDLLQWRNQVYNAVIAAFESFSEVSPQLHQLGFRDKAWNVNKLAHVARKHGLGEVCVRILNTMYGHARMEVHEAFVKIREQAKANLSSQGELMTGFNLLNTTSLDFYPVQSKAEILRLKGLFLQRLGDGELANQAYATSISLFKHLPQGWITWGNYCDQVYKDTGEQVWLEYAVACLLQGIKYGSARGRSHLARVLCLLAFENGQGSVGRMFERYAEGAPNWVWLAWIPQLLLALQRPEAPYTKPILQRLAQLYPQALYYWLRTYLLERRDVVQRADQLFKKQQLYQHERAVAAAAAAANAATEPSASGGGAGGRGPGSGPLGVSASGVSPGGREAVVAEGNQNPGTPSLSADGAGAGPAASSGPQSSDPGTGLEAASHGGSGPGGVPGDGPTGAQHPGAGGAAAQVGGTGNAGKDSFDGAKEVMETLRQKHPALASELEAMLNDLASRFVPLPEERLLAVVHALLQRCYKYPTATTADVPLSLKKELGGVCKACFSADTVKKHTEFVIEYKREFERDLDPELRDTFPTTLASLTQRLKHWEGILQSNVEERLPAVLKLEDESRHLRDWNMVDIDVPGQCLNDQEVTSEHTVKLERIGADVPIVRRHGSSHRRLTMVGSDGSQRHFLVQTSLTPSARSDERLVQLFRVLNRLLDKHKESRRRHLAFHTPVIVPVWPQVRLVEDQLAYSTLAEVYEVNCARYNREADGPIQHFKEKLNAAMGNQLFGDALEDLRYGTYQEITQKLVSENILSQFMYKSLPTSNHLWTFKKQFAAQLALSGCISYLLHIGGRSPNKILFAKNTGKVFQMDFHPAYDHTGLLEPPESVPFRLTRNIQTFFTPFGTDGLFVAAMAATAQAILAPKSQQMQHQLAMFFHDDLISWSWRRPPGIQAPPGGSWISASELKLKVKDNVESVMARITKIAPQTYALDEEPLSDEAAPSPKWVQRGVVELVEAALRPRNLCQMDPTWHPWF